jgi:CRP-like cAMP-binding protein
VPAIVVVDRLRELPLFAFVSADELFRIAQLGRQAYHEPGRELGRAHVRPDLVQFLLEGAVSLEEADGAARRLDAPAALGFDEVLEGRPLRHGIQAIGPVVCVTIARDELLTMLSDNVMLARGLFRSLIGDADRPPRFIDTSPKPLQEINEHGGSVAPIDHVRMLRRIPLFERATAGQLLDLAAIAHEVPLDAGAVLFGDTNPPSIYYVLDGEVQVESVPGDAVLVGRGSAVGLIETLVGASLGQRIVVTHEGRALRLDRDPLFDVLADHVDLLQSLFNAVRNATSSEDASAGALSVA